MANHTDVASARREVWKVTAYLSVITLVELGLGYFMFKMNWPDGSFLKTFTKIVILLLMLWKAYYIIAYFMHLKYENKATIDVVVIPCLLFVWFIIAFLWDGNSYKNLREKYDPYHPEHFSQPMKTTTHAEHTVPLQNAEQNITNENVGH